MACFVHDSTYTVMRQTCLAVCNSASRCCGELGLLALLVRDLITPFFAEFVVEDEVGLSGPGCIRTSRKGKNPSGEGCSMVKVR